MKKSILVFTACLCCFGIVNVLSHSGLREARKSITQRFESPRSRLPADLTRLLAGEFKGLVADYQLLEIGSFVGGGKKGSPQDWQNIYMALKKSLILDPYFQQTYVYVQGHLPWDGNMPEQAIELLNISRQHRDWDYVPGTYIGFNYYYFLNDYDRASEAFLETAKIEGAPALYAILGGRLALRSGPDRTRAAITLLAEMLESEELDGNARLEIKKRVEALKGVMLLERAVDTFRRRYQSPPSNLSDLVNAGILDQLPANPYGVDYHYNAETGRVLFDRIK